MAKVLVADDSIAVRKVAERLLTEAGLKVSLAACGEEAMAMLQHEPPDLLVCDVIMPDKSGYEVCSFVRSQSHLTSTPVLLVSGIVNAEVTRQAESCRANSVLKKPFQGSTLKDRVFELLEKYAPSGEATSDGVQAGGAVVQEKGKVYRITEGQLQVFRKATTRIQELEAAMHKEREQSAELAHRLAEASIYEAKVKELDTALSNERDAAAQLVLQLEEAEREVVRAKELDSRITHERDRHIKTCLRLADIEPIAGRAEQLETQLSKAHLDAEPLTTRISELESVLAQTLQPEQALVAEREHGEALKSALESERTQNATLQERVSELVPHASRTEELEGLLARECEQTTQLSQRLAEAELLAADAQARQEELSRKLSEIVNMAQ